MKKLALALLVVMPINIIARGSGFGGGFAAGAFTGIGISALASSAANCRRQTAQPVVVMQQPQVQQSYESSRDAAMEREEIRLDLIREENRRKELELRERELALAERKFKQSQNK